VVKPFVETHEQASFITALFEGEKLYGAVEFHKRYDESNVIARDLIQSGAIGLLSTVVVEYSQRVMIPTELFRKWVATTNIFQYLGVHYVDQIIFAAEARPIRVAAVGVKNKLIDAGIDAYDEIIATVEFSRLGENSFYAILRIGWVDVNSSSAMSQQRISYYGTEGHLLLDQTNRGVELQTHGGFEQINPYFSRLYGASSSEAYFSGYGITSIKSFIADVVSLQAGSVSLEELSLIRPTFEASIPSVVVTEAVGKSLELDGAWVTL
jgi:predicted dehydrogenase